jgi:hypothetical protein
MTENVAKQAYQAQLSTLRVPSESSWCVGCQ